MRAAVRHVDNEHSLLIAALAQARLRLCHHGISELRHARCQRVFMTVICTRIY
jgi:hypothetical protein